MNAQLNPPHRSAERSAEDARARLVSAGLRLFAQNGYAKTSTRELAEAAQVNVASISYYFGDKAGLYRAVFTEPLGALEPSPDATQDPALPLADALRAFYAGFLEPLKHGDLARLAMKLHFREMLEPTGLVDINEAVGCTDMHRGLIAMLCHHLGLAEADDELHRLALCLAGFGVQLHVGRDMADSLAPQLHQGAGALQGWSDSLTRYALVLVRAEAERRGLRLHTPTPPPSGKTR